jgi:hypothetical protein
MGVVAVQAPYYVGSVGEEAKNLTTSPYLRTQPHQVALVSQTQGLASGQHVARVFKQHLARGKGACSEEALAGPVGEEAGAHLKGRGSRKDHDSKHYLGRRGTSRHIFFFFLWLCVSAEGWVSCVG